MKAIACLAAGTVKWHLDQQQYRNVSRLRNSPSEPKRRLPDRGSPRRRRQKISERIGSRRTASSAVVGFGFKDHAPDKCRLCRPSCHRQATRQTCLRSLPNPRGILSNFPKFSGSSMKGKGCTDPKSARSLPVTSHKRSGDGIRVTTVTR